MTIKQRLFYLIGVYVFCGFLRAVLRETLQSLLPKIRLERLKAEAKVETEKARLKDRHEPDRYASS